MIVRLIALLAALALSAAAQTLSAHWEELTAPDFVKAIQQSKGTCALPFGIIEKHGPQAPTGTDLINVRFATLNAARQEYTVVFPEYYFGQIFEARHQPGTIAYSAELQLKMLQETTAEMARNGCSKIIIVNGHGGNTNLLQYFAQTEMASAKDYVVYVYLGGGPPATQPSRAGVDGHAGEGETSNVMASRPGLVHLDAAASESGKDQQRLDLPAGLYTGIWWYAKFPNHYQGDASGATEERGRLTLQALSDRIANAIRAVKSDAVSLRLQKEFMDAARHPLETRQ